MLEMNIRGQSRWVRTLVSQRSGVFFLYFDFDFFVMMLISCYFVGGSGGWIQGGEREETSDGGGTGPGRITAKSNT